MNRTHYKGPGAARTKRPPNTEKNKKKHESGSCCIRSGLSFESGGPLIWGNGTRNPCPGPIVVGKREGKKNL